MLTREDFLNNIGHFCTMEDGSKGFICKTKQGSPRVLHNLPEKYHGWPYEYEIDDDAPESFRKKFHRAWNICDMYDVRQSGVKKILKKCIDSKKTTKAKKAKQATVTIEDLEKNIGHCCTFKSGDKGYICKNSNGKTLVCFNTKQNDCGWKVDDDVPEYLHSLFKYAWFVYDNSHIKELGIVSIDPEQTDFQSSESKKTILDMTVKELLEKLDEIIKR